MLKGASLLFDQTPGYGAKSCAPCYTVSSELHHSDGFPNAGTSMRLRAGAPRLYPTGPLGTTRRTTSSTMQASPALPLQTLRLMPKRCVLSAFLVLNHAAIPPSSCAFSCDLHTVLQSPG